MSATDERGWGGAEKGLAAALVTCAMAVAVIGIRRPLFIDEAFSVIASSESLRALIAHLRLDSNEPLYFVLLHWWMGLFGASEIAARIPSIVFYALGIAAVYALGKEVSGSRVIGLYAAVFYGASLQAVHLAQKIRPYSLLGLAAALSTLYFFRCFGADKGAVRTADYAGFLAATLLGCFTHVWFVFLMFAQLVACVIFLPRRNWWRLLAGLVLPGGAFLLVWGRVLWQQAQSGAVDWLPKSDRWTLPGAIVEFYGGKKVGAVVLAVFSATYLIGSIARRGGEPAASEPEEETEKRRLSGNDSWALLVIFGLTLAVPIAVSVIKPLYWPGRHTVMALPPLAVLLAWWLAKSVRRPVIVGLAAALMVLAVGMDAATRRDLIESSDAVLPYAASDKAAAEVLETVLRPGDVLIFTGLSRASLEYYLRRSGKDQGVTLISFPEVNGQHLGWEDQRVNRGALLAEAGVLTANLAARSLAGSGAEGPRIFVVAGLNGLSNGALLDAVERQFRPLGVIKIRGAFFTAVAVYQ